MPSTHYRRKLRSVYNSSSRRYIVPTILMMMEGEDEITKTQNYFYKILESITLYNDFTDARSQLETVIDSTTSIVEFYKIIENIENNLLAVVENIGDGINPGIICARIEHIKTIINTLPADSTVPGYVSEMMLQIIDLISTSIDFTLIRSNLNSIQNYVNDTFGTIDSVDKINTIQTNLIDIICNIKDGIGSGIICTRVDYIKTLIEQL
jgi:hypothetical protein